MCGSSRIYAGCRFDARACEDVLLGSTFCSSLTIFMRSSSTGAASYGLNEQKCWVPHPRDVFDFVARVGFLDSQSALFIGSSLTRDGGLWLQ